jgi:serine/threonine protein kinase
MAKTFGNRWEIVEPIGEGGQGHVYTVRDLTGNPDALFVLKRLKNQNRIARFRKEVEATKSLEDKNIVRLIDFSLDSQPPYFVAEYCSGGSLITAPPYWRESPVLALRLFQSICEGVAVAHAQGIIHRDLKPDNIYLASQNGPAKVGDFGLCFFESGERITLTEEAVGSRFYMPPEYADGRAELVGKKGDTYSLGKVLYWLLSGRIFDREKHRDPQWDLRRPNEAGGFRNIYMEHVNRLLDKMIVLDPSKRLSVSTVCDDLPLYIELVERQYNPLGPGMWEHQRCYYCGYGKYRPQRSGQSTAENIGFGGRGAPDWRILVCEACGHVQGFRIDMADRKDWWYR